MGFRFSLAAVLRLREIAEQREERLLGQIINQLAQAHQTLADLGLQRHQLTLQRETALRRAAFAFELTGFYAQLRQVDDLQIAGREHIAKLILLREQQTKIFEATHRDTELLSDLKVEQRKEFEKTRARQEQSAMDDNFSSRRRFP